MTIGHRCKIALWHLIDALNGFFHVGSPMSAIQKQEVRRM